jgi:hypothetical protein
MVFLWLSVRQEVRVVVVVVKVIYCQVASVRSTVGRPQKLFAIGPKVLPRSHHRLLLHMLHVGSPGNATSEPLPRRAAAL